MDELAWQLDALCAEEHPGADWFPEIGHLAEVRAARTVCARCSVRVECLAYALDEKIDHGLWGGAVTSERDQLRKRGVTGAVVRRLGSLVLTD